MVVLRASMQPKNEPIYPMESYFLRAITGKWLPAAPGRLSRPVKAIIVPMGEAPELSPCPRCGKPAGEFKDGGSGRFRYLVICGACAWSPGPARIKDVATFPQPAHVTRARAFPG